MPDFIMMPGRAVIFVVKRTDFRGIDLYKNTFYELDENIAKVFVNNEFAVEPLVDFKTKWTLKQTADEYLKEKPDGPKAMLAKQYLALKRGIVQTPQNYKEKPPEPVILDETPHEKRAEEKVAAKKAETEPVDD